MQHKSRNMVGLCVTNNFEMHVKDDIKQGTESQLTFAWNVKYRFRRKQKLGIRIKTPSGSF